MREKSRRKVLEGTVIRGKTDKTVVVNVERKIQHSLFGKIVKRSKNYMVHDEHNKCSEGATVRIVETRPVSKSKHWRVLEILKDNNTSNQTK